MQGRRERVEVATAGGRGLRRGLAFELHCAPAAVAWIRFRVKLKGPVDPTVRACVAGVCVCGIWAARLTCIVTRSLGLGRGCSTSATRRSRDTPSRQTVLPAAVVVAVAGIVSAFFLMNTTRRCETCDSCSCSTCTGTRCRTTPNVTGLDFVADFLL